MVYFRVTSKTAADFSSACAAAGVKLTAVGSDTIRIVLNLGVDRDDVATALEVMGEAAR